MKLSRRSATQLFDLLVAVAPESRRLQHEVVVDVDRRQRNQFGDTRSRVPRDDVGEAVAQCAGIEEDRRGASLRVGGRGEYLDIAGKLGGVRGVGERPHLRAGAMSREISGRPTLPVAPVTTIVMGTPWENDVRSTKDGMAGAKVTHRHR